jgi:hypothetical protein
MTDRLFNEEDILEAEKELENEGFFEHVKGKYGLKPQDMDTVDSLKNSTVEGRVASSKKVQVP